MNKSTDFSFLQFLTRPILNLVPHIFTLVCDFLKSAHENLPAFYPIFAFLHLTFPNLMHMLF